MEFAAVGDNCVDWFVPPMDECYVGGNAVNVAVQLAMLGCSVGYFGAVGQDRAGDAVRKTLESKNIDVSNLITVPGRKTAHTVIEVSNGGDRTFVFEDFGACADYHVTAVGIEKLRRVRHVHIGWLADGGALKRALEGSGVTISQDLGVNAEPANLSPAGLDVAFISSGLERAEARIREALQAGARIAVATMGAAGSMAGSVEGFFRTTALPIDPEDTTGAGDAYFAGFLQAFVAGCSLMVSMQRGAENAASACMYRGGFPQQPAKGLLDH